MGRPLDEERRRRAHREPMWRYFHHHQHLELDKLLLGSVSVPVTRAPATPAPSPEAPVAEAAEQLAADLAAGAQERRRSEQHRVHVFDPAAIAEARARLGPPPSKTDGKRDTTALARSVAALDRAAQDDGWRSVPWTGPDAIVEPFADFGPAYDNFRPVIDHLQVQWMLATRSISAAEARLDPILLVGPPGIGKTRFASLIAERLGVRISVFSAGGAQDAMQLCGSDARWYNSRPGLVYDALSLGDSAAPILVVDEIDKIAPQSGGNRDTPLNSLLDLLEPESARRYRDMSAQLAMNASHVLVIATANDARELSAPLRSRLTEFHVNPPTAEQRRLIVERQFEALCASHQCRNDLELDEASVEAATETPDLDVRSLLRMLRTGFARALVDNSTHVILATPRRGSGRRRIGFV